MTARDKTAERVARLLHFLFAVGPSGRGWDDVSIPKRVPWLEYAGLVLEVLEEEEE